MLPTNTAIPYAPNGNLFSGDNEKLYSGYYNIVTLLNINRNTVKKHLKELASKNLIRQNGTGKGTWYSPAENPNSLPRQKP